MGTIRLTPAEITQCHKDGKCFHCDELFTNDHKLLCKQLFSIEVVDDNDDTYQARSRPFPFMLSPASSHDLSAP
jgi:hypothetical protein